MNGGVIFLIFLIFLVAGSYGGWFGYARWNAKRNGLPPPSPNPIAAFKNRSGGGASNYPGPAPGGIKGFIDTLMRKFKGKNRSAAGAYEDTTHEAQYGGRGAGSRLDSDEAWSTRVGDETYHEEQELGLHDHRTAPANPFNSNTAYGGASMPHADAPRGRSRTRESYDEHHHGQPPKANPFGDEHTASLRGTSPRPNDTSYHGGATVMMPKAPTDKAASVYSVEGRRSVFKEDMA